VVATYLAFNLYARRIDRNIIQPNSKRANAGPHVHGWRWFKDFGIPVGGVLVNMVIDREPRQARNAAEFVKNRVAAQQEHMQTIWQEFDHGVRAIVPLFETEVRGVPMLKRLCDAIFVADETTDVPEASVDRLQQVGASP
jgi:hypothetical protein